MQINFITLTKAWTAFSDLVGTVEEDAEYIIQNRGNNTLVALESDTLPEENAQSGILIPAYDEAVYVKGSQNLYLRSFNQNCLINITKGE